MPLFLRIRTAILSIGLSAAFTVGLAPASIAASIEARHGAVAAEHVLASRAGVEILEQGGNAVDAAAAAALATGVVNPSSSGIGGGGFAVVWIARDAKAAAIDFRESAPRAAFEQMYVGAGGDADPAASRTGPLAVGVPGEPRGLEFALRRYGTMKFRDVAAPAIRLAREGFKIEAHLAKMIAAGRDRIAADPGLAAVFLHEDGSPRREGELLKRPALATTLQRMAVFGVDEFYEGDIAADIVRTVESADLPEGANAKARPLGAADLAAYRVIEREPLRIEYRGASLLAMPPPSSGGGVMGQILGVLSAYDLATTGRDGPTWPHLLADTMKAAFADRALLYGDPDFVDVPIARLLGPAHAAATRARLDPQRAVPSSVFAPRVEADDDAGTSHISVVDRHGNAVALTTSVNTGFGAGLSVPGRDIVLNNTMDDFSAQPGRPNAFGLIGSHANAVAAGKRPLSSMSPTIVVQDGRVRLVAGASGGPLIITSTLQTVVGVLDFGLGAEEAVGAPRLHHQWIPEILMIEKDFPEKTAATLRSIGHRTMPMPGRASVQAVEVRGRGDERRLLATSDPRKGGVPAGH